MSEFFFPKEVEALSAALPPDGANPIGVVARAALVNQVKGSTPGNYSQLFGTGPAFKKVFFPGYAPVPAQGSVTGDVGLGAPFWAQMAVACLCGEMYDVTSRLRPQILIAKIRQDLSSWNSTLRRNISRFYARVAQLADTSVKVALLAFPDSESRAFAREHYKKGLTSESWINKKVAQDASGAWANRDWELFHHWIKLAALGATDAEIDTIITEAAGKGLPIPASLSAGAWRSWSVWMGADIGSRDFGDAQGPILETKYIPVPGSFPAAIPEGNSFEFTANSQPGNKYRQAPSGSCFAPGARVVMADGSLKAIEAVQPGDEVKTPDGQRAVELVATPDRGGRPLYQIDGVDFAFTGSHPFLVYDGEPETTGVFAAANPSGLVRSIPSLAQFGVRAMAGGSPPPLTQYTEGGNRPYRGEKVRIEPKRRDDLLYDLFLDIGEDGRSEYFVGDTRTQLLVSSEIPRYLAAPATTACMVKILEEISPTILTVLKDVPDGAFADLLSLGLDGVGRSLMARIGAELEEETARARESGERVSNEPQDVLDTIRGLSVSFVKDSSEYDRRMGLLYDLFVARFGPPFQAAVRLGWRTFDLSGREGATVLAVTVYALELFGAEVGIPVHEAEIHVELSCGEARYSRALPVLPSATVDRSYYVTDHVAYFPEWRNTLEPAKEAVAGPSWQITVGLKGAGERRAPFRGTLVLPRDVQPGYESLSAQIRDAAGEVLGQAFLDVRTLNVGGLVADQEAKEKWSSDQETTFAACLATLAARFIRRNFQRTVEVLQPMAATEAGQKAKLG